MLLPKGHLKIIFVQWISSGCLVKGNILSSDHSVDFTTSRSVNCMMCIGILLYFIIMNIDHLNGNESSCYWYGFNRWNICWKKQTWHTENIESITMYTWYIICIQVQEKYFTINDMVITNSDITFTQHVHKHINKLARGKQPDIMDMAQIFRLLKYNWNMFIW